mgnify:CR=1 FL=1
MQDIILLQYLSKKLHTYVYKFSLNQEMLFSYCGVLSFQDSYMCNLSFRNYLLNTPQKSSTMSVTCAVRPGTES